MTYNVHYGDPDLSKIAEVICTAGADVVALQEVDVHFSERSGFADQAAEIASKCGMEFRYGPIYDMPPLEPGKPNRQFGVAVLTRFPVVSWKNHLLTRLSTQTPGAPPTPMPGFLQVTVDVDGTEVDVFSTHLDYRPDPAVRKTQVAEMLAVIGSPTRPTVLMGDMNAGPAKEELAPLFARLRDAWAGHADPGNTIPADNPNNRIDYIFLAGPLRAASARVLDTTASDHRPVVAELVFEGR
ncbi:MAG TPA: endonuclease/exonuclease/phosphatase family protein [Longimicrobiales bacterium]|nr:endonuclease/exonuclease/phosphatase family protein [Longimicrobiales bacterium]